MQRLLTKESRQAAKASRIAWIKNNYQNVIIEDAPGVTVATYQSGTALYYLEYWIGNAGNSTYNAYRSEEQRNKGSENVKASAARSIECKAKRKIENKGQQSSHAAAAAHLREALKKSFPNTKFSVTSESFAGGDAVRVHWTDGPTVSEVEKIGGRYQYGHFNGMEDIYEYSNNIDGLPQARYVTESRSISDQYKQPIMGALETLCTDPHAYHSADQIFYRLLAHTPIKQGAEITEVIHDHETASGYRVIFKEVEPEPETEKPGHIEVPAGKIQVITYGKGLAVIGETRQIKDKLKEIGGIFQPRLTCGPGWIFPTSKAEELKQAFLK